MPIIQNGQGSFPTVLMGHSQHEKAASRERIVHHAARAFRISGYDRIGIADLMKLAGLTHGGFYGHFRSRDELAAAAIHQAFKEGRREFANRRARSKASPFVAMVDAYLGEEHLKGVHWGCPVAALSGDTARAGPRTRSAFTEEFDTYVRTMSSLLGGNQRRKAAIAVVCAMAGAVAIARAIESEEIKGEVLEAVHHFCSTIVPAAAGVPGQVPARRSAASAERSKAPSPRKHRRRGRRLN